MSFLYRMVIFAGFAQSGTLLQRKGTILLRPRLVLNDFQSAADTLKARRQHIKNCTYSWFLMRK